MTSTRPVVFLDTETDSLGPARRAWEIGIIRRDEAGDTEHHFFVAADLKNADPKSLEVGGFWDRHPSGRKISGKPEVPCEPVRSVHDAARDVMRLTFGARIVGAVPSFDTYVLERLLRSQGYVPAWHYRLVCVESMVLAHLERDPGGLRACAEALGLDASDARTAMGDARMCRAIYDHLIPARPGGAAMIECGYRGCARTVPAADAWPLTIRTGPGGVPGREEVFCSPAHATAEFDAAVDDHLAQQAHAETIPRDTSMPEVTW